MLASIIVVLLLLGEGVSQQLPQQGACFDVPTSSPGRDLPLCGNGILDPGELCDDGNRFDGDGCSAFCSHFDALSHAATLAGSTATCPNRLSPVLGGPTSSVLFCNLRAIDTALDGSHVLLGDGGKLLRYNLFTDTTTGQISQLQASITVPFKAICSIGVLAYDGAIVVHDCGASRFHIAMREGTHAQLLVDFSPWLAPPRLNLKSFYNRADRYVVTAGVIIAPPPLNPFATSNNNNNNNNNNNVGGVELDCVAVYGLKISSFENFYAQAAPSLLATIPCTLYGVWERGTQITSFDARGMEPHLVTRERCPSTFRAGQWCYAVYLQRTAHMEFLRAYIPEDGGLDLQYYAFTTNLYDNALGAPLIRGGGVNGSSNSLVYTLRGACFQVESRKLTAGGKAPPAATLGNACRRAPQLGLRCTTPFNNPFITDVMTSPMLLPNGLSVTHTHAELSAIFSAGCPRLANVSSAGPLLYQSTLTNVYANTTPVDFVELAGTLDIVYITPTSVGLISTKRILFQDRAQPGYVRATNLIYCPPGLFGFVGTVCAPCNHTKAPGYYTSVAWQIQCPPVGAAAANSGGVAAGATPPFETFTVVASRNVTVDTIRTGVCIFMESKGVPCPASPDLTMLPPQQFNIAADALESTLAAGTAAAVQPMQPQDLIHCLIENAERATGRTLLRTIPAEYNTRIISLGTGLLQASAVKSFDTTLANYSEADIAPAIAAACLQYMVVNVGSFLACAARQQQYVTASSTAPTASGGRGRRLLQVNTATAPPQQLATTEHHSVALGSSTIISWARTLPLGWDGTDGGMPSPSAPSANTKPAPFEFPLWLGVIIGVGGALLLAILFCLVYRRRFRRAPASSTASTAADYAFYMRRLHEKPSYSSR